MKQKTAAEPNIMINGYDNTLTDLIKLLESSCRAAARAVNTIMTATYWEIGRRIVELEQSGDRANASKY